MTHNRPARTTPRRILRILLGGSLLVIAAIATLGHRLTTSSPSTAASPTIDGFHSTHGGGLGTGLASTVRPAHRPAELPGSVWPADGQAAVILSGQPRIHVGPNQHAAPIASLAKMMTAYLVLRDHPLGSSQGGPTITLTDADVADTDRRAGQQESVVPVAAGEQLTERQALEALLLPSANNIAAVLARWDAGSEGRFVARMNATARSLGMADTRYTDPSGYDDGTVSTAADQIRIVERAMRLPVFAAHRRHTERDAAGRRHRPKHQRVARARRVRWRQDRLGQRGWQLLRVPRDPLGRRQADDDHGSRTGPARGRPGRRRSRGRRRHRPPHRRSTQR